MRMKAVCEATGLTDRTVRYYIEEGLITPDYTESYTGRKTFDFCESDIHQLNDIAVLRKFGFTVAEIRDMLRDPARIMPALDALRARKQARITEEQALMLALDRLTEPFGSVRELALALSAPVENTSVPPEDSRIGIGTMLKRLILGFIRGYVAWAPIAASVAIMIAMLRRYEYPHFRLDIFAILTVFLTPSVLVLNWHRLQERFGWQKTVKGFLWVLCVLSFIPAGFCAGFTFSHSETTDIRNYRIFDGQCRVNRIAFFDEFFPANARYSEVVQDEEGYWHTVYFDTSYYYRYDTFFDYTYDVYAEWPLEPESFDAEIRRVRELFATYEHPLDQYTYMETQKGPWTCLILYKRQEPFVEVKDSYFYYIFAFDPDTLRVRYICCDSLEDGADQPYYLELDWE